ncbi:MAG: tetratricopeptide repeat protein [Sumerlaeia bacterium]
MTQKSPLSPQEERQCLDALRLLGITDPNHPVLSHRGYFTLFLNGLSPDEMGNRGEVHPSVAEFREIRDLLSRAGTIRLRRILAEQTMFGRQRAEREHQERMNQPVRPMALPPAHPPQQSRPTPAPKPPTPAPPAYRPPAEERPTGRIEAPNREVRSAPGIARRSSQSGSGPDLPQIRIDYDGRSNAETPPPAPRPYRPEPPSAPPPEPPSPRPSSATSHPYQRESPSPSPPPPSSGEQPRGAPSRPTTKGMSVARSPEIVAARTTRLIETGECVEAYRVSSEFLAKYGLHETVLNGCLEAIKSATTDRTLPTNMLFECEELTAILGNQIPDMSALCEHGDLTMTRCYRMVQHTYEAWVEHGRQLSLFRYAEGAGLMTRDWIKPSEFGFLLDIVRSATRYRLPSSILHRIYEGARRCADVAHDVIADKQKAHQFEAELMETLLAPIGDLFPDMSVDLLRDIARCRLQAGDKDTAAEVLERGLAIRPDDRILRDIKARMVTYRPGGAPLPGQRRR